MKKVSPQGPASRSEATRNLVVLALFMAIIIVLAATPLGFINIFIMRITIIHIPVIIGSILLGPQKGAFLGGIFGLSSLITGTITPGLMSFAFSPFIPVPGLSHGSPLALVVCFVPRILVGIVPWYVYKAISKLFKGGNGKIRSFAFAVAGIAGSLTNTILVMSLICLLFKDAYASAIKLPITALLGVVLSVVGTNGVPEAIAAAIVTAAVCSPISKRFMLGGKAVKK